MESEKVIQTHLLTKQKQTHRHRKQTSGYQTEKGVGISQKFGINTFTLLYIKKINDKILLYGTGENIQYLVISYNGKKFYKEYMCIHVCVCVVSHFDHVGLCVTLRIAAHQDPLSKGFSRQEYWSGLPCPHPGDPPDICVYIYIHMGVCIN